MEFLIPSLSMRDSDALYPKVSYATEPTTLNAYSYLLQVFLFTIGVFCFSARLDVYIYDYLVKKKLHNTAKSFMTEGKVSPDPVGERHSM